MSDEKALLKLESRVDVLERRHDDLAEEQRKHYKKLEGLDKEVGTLGKTGAGFMTIKAFDEKMEKLEGKIESKIGTIMENNQKILVWMLGVNLAVVIIVGGVGLYKAIHG